MKKRAFPSLSVTLVLIIAAFAGILADVHQPFWVIFKAIYLVLVFGWIAANLVGFALRFNRSRSNRTR